MRLSDGGSEQLRKIEELKNGIEQKNEIIILKTAQTEEIAKTAGDNEKAIADNVSLTNAAEKRISEIKQVDKGAYRGEGKVQCGSCQTGRT